MYAEKFCATLSILSTLITHTPTDIRVCPASGSGRESRSAGADWSAQADPSSVQTVHIAATITARSLALLTYSSVG